MITTLRTLGPSLAKTWLADGTIGNYDSARQYTFKQRPVDNINDLYKLLNVLQDDPRSCIIRGTPTAATLASTRVVLRNLESFEDKPSRLFMVDVDNWDGPLAAFILTLPECLRDADYVLQYSGSHGHPTKPGLRAHLWYWLETPLTSADAEAWSRKWVPQADCTVHRTVQVNYTSRPILQGGQVDPVPKRLHRMQGPLTSTVVIPDDMPVPEPQRSARAGGAGRTHVDPRGKPGVIGALCRAFNPGDIVALFPDQFEAGSTDARITWRGHSPEGIGVTSDGHGLFNTHASSPIGAGSANLFDFARLHVYGPLDDGLDPEAFELNPPALPSYAAMAEYARSLPEVQAELAPSTPEAAKKVIEVIEDVRDANAEQELAKEVSKEQRLSNIASLVAKCESIHHLEHFVGRQVARAPLSPAEREVIAGRVQERSRALNSGRQLPIALVRSWLAPAAVDTQQAFPHLTREATPKLTIENLEVLCGRLGVSVRYDVIQKRRVITGGMLAYSDENYDNASLSTLQSRCAEADMPNNTAMLNGMLTALADRHPFNPALEWIETVPWDGRPRIPELCDTLTLRPDFPRALAEMILRKWLIQGACAVASPKPLSTRGVLVLQGPQYIGKTRWLQSLVGEQRPLILTGVQIDPHDKDTVKQAISHWIVELGEIGGTFRKADNDALKAFLGKEFDIFRLPYAALETKYPRRTIFAASVNEEEFLADQTGTSRFWALPVTALDHTHTVDMQQVWAEMLAAWRGGEQHWLEIEEMDRVTLSNTDFEIPTSVAELVKHRFPWESARLKSEDVIWKQHTSFEIARLCGLSVPTDKQLSAVGLAVFKITKRKSEGANGNKRHWVPMLKSEVVEDAATEWA